MTIDNRITIDHLRPADWPAVARVYQAGIETNQATFTTEVPGWEAWDAAHRPDCRFVGRLGEVVVAFAALTPVSHREVYAGVAEVSVYVAEEARGRGIGSQMLDVLVAASEAAGVWTLQSSIFPENAASLQLHLRHGFRILGRRERVAQHHGVWRDTLLMERRSESVGV